MPNDTEKPDLPEEDPNSPAEQNPRYKNAKPGETVRAYKERLTKQIQDGWKQAQANKKETIGEEKKREREEARDRQRAEAAIPIRKDIDLCADILWAYQNINQPKVRWGKAPSRGAPGLLMWAREAAATRKEFYKSLVPKALAMQEARERATREKEQRKAAEEEKKKTGGEPVEDLPLGEVERMLGEFAE